MDFHLFFEIPGTLSLPLFIMLRTFFFFSLIIFTVSKHAESNKETNHVRKPDSNKMNGERFSRPSEAPVAAPVPDTATPTSYAPIFPSQLPPGKCANGVGCSDCQFCPDGTTCNLCPVSPGWCPGFDFHVVGCSGCQWCPDGSRCNLCTASPTLVPTAEPTSFEPTYTPTIETTFPPTIEVTNEPTIEATDPPQSTFAPSSDEPTAEPTSEAPTFDPTVDPSSAPSPEPTVEPSFKPTRAPVIFSLPPVSIPVLPPILGRKSSAPSLAPVVEANSNTTPDNASSSGLSQAALIAMIVVLCFACVLCLIFAAFWYSSRRSDQIKKRSELQDWTEESDHPISPRFRALSNAAAALSPSKLFSRKTAEITPAV